ncbi:MAG: hypothetical protein H6622_18155 [Halobacteriovoraceae bacterium]|nr:hypothetical protein [Halobacteriovoraceae bacterium]
MQLTLTPQVLAARKLTCSTHEARLVLRDLKSKVSEDISPMEKSLILEAISEISFRLNELENAKESITEAIGLIEKHNLSRSQYVSQLLLLSEILTAENRGVEAKAISIFAKELAKSSSV